MPRKSTAAELQAEEAATNSPLRRSSRIVNVSGGTPAGVTTRRTSQTSDPQANTPAKATRGRRASAQDSEEKVETKPVSRARKASVLAEEESQKETPSTPARRGRKPSVSTEPTESAESEKPKPVRGRRTSTASNSEEPDEKKTQKTAPVRSRRGSANVEPEAEDKVTTRTPARATTRRRSSAAENAVAEVLTPAKRTTRGRKASDAEEIGDAIEEVKKPAARGRKKSVNQEEEGNKNEEPVKPAARRGRKPSADHSPPSTPPKPPRRPGSHHSINKEADFESSAKDSTKDISEVQKVSGTNDDIDTEEEMSPIVLTDVSSVIVTPLKKRKILDKMEAELDLSIINEISDDVDNSKCDESSKETTEKDDNKSVKPEENKYIRSTENLVHEELNTSPLAHSLEEDGGKTSPIDKSLNLADETRIGTPSPQNTSSSIKRLSPGTDDNPSPRKSPRLSEKLSRSNMPKEENVEKEPSPRKPRHIVKENDFNVSEKSQTSSLISSGSDGSFRFHLSKVATSNSDQLDKENSEKDLLNTSKESTGSNKENIEEVDALNVNKVVLGISEEIPLQKQIVVARLSNVFKSNQKDYSFMEPMEVDEDSVICSESSMKKDSVLDDPSVQLNQEVLEKGANSQTECPTEPIIKLRKSSLAVTSEPSEKPTEKSENNPAKQAETEHLPQPDKITPKPDLSETEGSDSNLIIEETHDTVDISIKPKTKKVEITSTATAQRRSKSPRNNDASLIINQPLEQVKVVLLGKSSSPFSTKRKSKSPVPKIAVNMDDENDVPRRRSKSKSKSPSPATRSPCFISGNKLSTENEVLMMSRRSKSKSRSPSPRKSPARSPSFLCVDLDDTSSSRKSKSTVTRNRSKSESPVSSSQETSANQQGKKSKLRRTKSRSPLPDLQEYNYISPKSPFKNSEKTPVISDGKKLRSMSRTSLPDSQEMPRTPGDKNLSPTRSVEAKLQSPSIDPEGTPIIQDDKNLKSRSVKSTSGSPLPHSQESLIDQVNKELASGRSTRSKSKSPLPESSALEESFEKPKGTEEIIVTNEKKSVENPSVLEQGDSAKDKNTSLKHLPDSIACKTAETELEMSDINFTGSEQTNIQDKTEYYSAIATTNNESDFTSLVNTDIEVTRSEIKGSDSPHYDFVLDSDDDDELLDSKNHSSVIGIETSVLDKKTMALQRELGNQSQVIMEVKKSRKLKSPKKSKTVVDSEESKEVSEVEVSSQVKADEHPENAEKGKDLCKENDNCQGNNISEDQKSLTVPTKSDSEETSDNESSNKAVESVLIEESLNTELEEKFEEILVSSTGETEHSNKADSDSAKTKKESMSINESLEVDAKNEADKNIAPGSPKLSNEDNDSKRASVSKLTVEDSEDNTDRNFEAISKEDSENDVSPEQSEQNIENTSKECHVDESQVKTEAQKSYANLYIGLHKIDTRSEDIKERLPDEDSDEEMQSKTGFKTKKPHKVIEKAAKDETGKKKLQKSKAKKQDLNKFTEESDEKVESEKSKNKSSKKHKDKQEDSKISESVVKEVSTCEMIAQNVNKVNISQPDNDNIINKEPTLKDSKTAKTKPSLGDFAAAKLEEYLNSKGDEFESTSEEEEEESEAEYNEFIDGMAEEGEEDTPSEDSNQIIDEGESIGSSSNEEVSDEEYDENDSFICDEEAPELLSGDEYDLGNEKNKKTKKSRIIDPSALGEEDIIKIPKKKVQKEEPKKRSRIITVSDSSEDEQDRSILEISVESKNEEPKIIDSSKPIVIEESKNEDTNEVIIIIEDSNIAAISQRINTLVESFCSTVKSGEISLNLSLEYEGVSQEKDKNEAIRILSDIKICSAKPEDSQEEQQVVVDLKDVEEQGNKKLNSSLNEDEDLREVLNRKNLKRKISKILVNVTEEIKEPKKRKMHKKNKKKAASAEKLATDATSKSKKRSKIKPSLAEGLQSQISSFSIMEQLITDVKNRPRRKIKPTKTEDEVTSSWVTTEIKNLKPSTSPVTKQERNKILQPKLHPKDFKNQMLSDNKRVKRIDTKVLLKKKGAFC